MQKSLRFILLTAILMSTTSLLFAQSGNNSPFSRFGIGDLNDNNLISIRQMGGLSASFADAYQINIVNPASYTFLRSTAFDFGVSVANKSLENNAGDKETRWSGNLDYIALAFPLRNPLNEAFEREKKDWRLGMGFALQPISEVAYDITNTETDLNFGEVERNFSGNGGAWKALWGNSFKYNNFSVGLNLGYMFGNINYQRNVTFIDRPEAFNNSFETNYNMSGFLWNAGGMYQIVLNQNEIDSKKTVNTKQVLLGLYFGSATNFSTKADIFEGATLIDVFQDTLTYVEDQNGKGTLPGQVGFGATYYNGGKLGVGVNYELNAWSQYKNDANPESLSDSHRVSLGGFVRPNLKSFKFRDRIFYRFGLQYQTEPITIQDEQLKNVSLNLGLGLPFVYQRKISHMNLGVSIGTRGSTKYLRENYIKIGASFTFNDDEWFIRRQYN